MKDASLSELHWLSIMRNCITVLDVANFSSFGEVDQLAKVLIVQDVYTKQNPALMFSSSVRKL